MTDQAAKNQFIQLCRGVCIAAVVLIHCTWQTDASNIYGFYYSIVLRQILNFAVGLFIFLAGYCANTEKLKTAGYFIKRLKKLLLPYLIWSVIYIGVRYIVGNKPSINDAIIMLLSGTASHQLYFIIVILQLTILTPLIIRLDRYKAVKIIFWLISPAYYLYMYYARFDIPMRQTWFPAWFILYYAGLQAQNINYKISARKNLLMVMVALALSIFESIFLYRINGDYSIFVTQLKLSSVLYAFSIAGLVLSLKNTAVNPKNMFVRLGNASYGVYYIHIAVLSVVNKALIYSGLIQIPLIAQQLIQLSVTLMISYAVIKLGQKILKKHAAIFGF